MLKSTLLKGGFFYPHDSVLDHRIPIVIGQLEISAIGVYCLSWSSL
jgi:hypothetical protein